MNIRLFRLVGALTSMIAACATSAAALQIVVKPLFLGMPQAPHFPVLIDVKNSGPNTRGEVRVGGSDLTTHYPIDIPSGSEKAFIAYVSTTQMFEPLPVVLDTDSGRVSDRLEPPTGYGGRPILTIESNPGGLGFLRAFKGDSVHVSGYYPRNNKPIDVYAKPEILPDRAAGYDGIWAVVLGEGAERMSDSAVAAIHNYVLLGGNLLFIGGASPQVLRDPRWSDLVPVATSGTDTRSSLTFALNGNEIAVTGPITVSVGTLTAGAQSVAGSASPVMATKAYGAGTAIYFCANPFEEPLSKRDNLDLFTSLLSLTNEYSANEALENLAGQLGSANDPYMNGSRYHYYYYSGASSAMPPSRYESPFNVQMPQSWTVFWILFAYAVLVAPVNLAVLRKLRRAEWAWWTAPAISLVFAGLFFNFASSLYSSMLSKQTSGLLVADVNGKGAYFEGSTQLFFPRGGRYDLGLQNAEYVTGQERNDEYRYYYRGGPGEHSLSDGIDPVDVGQVLVPAMSVSNLSFGKLQYGQRLTNAPHVTVQFSRDGDHLQGTVKNESIYRLQQCMLLFDGKKVTCGDLAGGETKKIEQTAVRDQDENGSLSHLSQGRVAFAANVAGFAPGCQIGTEAPGGKLMLFENVTGAVK